MGRRIKISAGPGGFKYKFSIDIPTTKTEGYAYRNPNAWMSRDDGWLEARPKYNDFKAVYN